jgi:hypothetical protein
MAMNSFLRTSKSPCSIMAKTSTAKKGNGMMILVPCLVFVLFLLLLLRPLLLRLLRLFRRFQFISFTRPCWVATVEPTGLVARPFGRPGRATHHEERSGTRSVCARLARTLVSPVAPRTWEGWYWSWSNPIGPTFAPRRHKSTRPRESSPVMVQPYDGRCCRRAKRPRWHRATVSSMALSF